MNPENEPYVDLQDQAVQQKHLFSYLYSKCDKEADATKLVQLTKWVHLDAEKAQDSI